MPRHLPVRQNALTVAIPIQQSRVEELRQLFSDFLDHEGGIEDNPALPFSKLETVHFARFVIVERSLDASGERRALDSPLLLYSSNYDGELDAHLGEIVRAGALWLHSVLTHCECYGHPDADNEALIAFLKSHRLPYAGFYVGTVGLSVAQIREEEALRKEIQRFLDAGLDAGLNAGPDAEPLAIRSAIRKHLEGTDFAWALEPPPEPSFLGTLPDGTGRSLAFLIGVIVVTLLLGVGAVAFLWAPPLVGAVVSALAIALPTSLLLVFLLKEKTDPEFPRTRYDARAQELAAREDQIVQNQMTILADIKKGWLRSLVIRTVFAVINLLARWCYRHGRLGKIATIHFARWVILEEERAVLFLSNYTGSWEEYLGDFVDRAANGLTAVWSNTVLFPRTTLLTRGGARDEARFKAWTRAQQMETDLWYSAYRELSMPNILNNHQIRAGLGRALSADETRQWLRRL